MCYIFAEVHSNMCLRDADIGSTVSMSLGDDAELVVSVATGL